MSFESAIKAWIESVTGYASANVKMAYGGGPVPETDHVVFSVDSEESFGTQFSINREESDDDIITEHEQPTSITVQVDVFARDGRVKLNQLLQSTVSWEHRQFLSDEGAALATRSMVRNLSDVSNDEPEFRFQADFTFNYGSQFTETEAAVHTNEITGKLVHPDDTEEQITVATVLEE